MSDLAAIYRLMAQTELNQRVGGGDPELVGQFCFYNLQQHLKFRATDKILDFGCGIGRVAAQVASQESLATAKVVGLDIMPDVIDFCRSNIASTLLNTSFDLISGSNVHYNKYIAGSQVKPLQDPSDTYGHYFDKAYAFSVFTHIDTRDFSDLLKFVGRLMAKDSEFLFTCFLLTAYSRFAIAKQACTFGFDKPAYELDGQVFIGNGADRLAFIAFDIGMVERLVFEAGFVIARVEYGGWRGSGFESSLQDIVVVRLAS